MSAQTVMTRRSLLAAIGLGAAMGLLAACGGQAATGGAAPTSAGAPTSAAPAPVATTASSAAPTTAPAAAAAPTTAAVAPAAPTAQPQAAAAAKTGSEVHFLCRPDIVTAYGADAAVKAYTDSHPGSKLTLEQPPQGVDLLTKVRAAIASNSLVWDGYSVMVPPWDTAQWVEAQVIQPLDDLIAQSSEKDAKDLLNGVIPTIKEASKYKGKVYAIPGNVGSVALQWYWEPLKGIGLTKQPATWDETYLAAKQIKAKYPDYMPFAQNCTPLCGYIALLFSATAPKDLFTQDGLMNIQAQGSIDALNWMKKMVKEGLMPPTDQGVNEDWDRKKIAMLMSYDVKGEGAQKTYGYDAADTGINIFPKADTINGGTPFWMNSSVVFNKAKNPQGMADFFVWWFGPSNGPGQQTMVATAAKPCYSYTYDKYVKTSTNFAWEQTGIDLVAKSAAFPVNTYFNIQSDAIKVWEDKFLKPDGTLSAEDAMKGAAKDIADKIAAQKG